MHAVCTVLHWKQDKNALDSEYKTIEIERAEQVFMCCSFLFLTLPVFFGLCLTEACDRVALLVLHYGAQLLLVVAALRLRGRQTQSKNISNFYRAFLISIFILTLTADIH